MGEKKSLVVVTQLTTDSIEEVTRIGEEITYEGKLWLLLGSFLFFFPALVCIIDSTLALFLCVLEIDARMHTIRHTYLPKIMLLACPIKLGIPPYPFVFPECHMYHNTYSQSNAPHSTL